MLRKEPDRKTVAFHDLDQLHVEVVKFRLHGKEFTIKPLTALEFFQYTQEYGNFQNLGQKEKVTADELQEAYFRVFSAVLPDITRDDVAKCSQQQAAVLFGLVLDSVTGKKNPEELKKKTLSLPTRLKLTG